jgi:hypothetical protein
MSLRIVPKGPEIQMSGEAAIHETTHQARKCGGTSTVPIDLPCGHHYSIGATSPPPPRDIRLVLNEDMQTSGHDMIFTGDDESRMEHIKSLAAEAVGLSNASQDRGR